ncbi:MAG: HAMP domain-containing sensor histidine kinase [bacterium]|nr:HAMP domain-containing sensor histidine kinase [bacterium]
MKNKTKLKRFLLLTFIVSTILLFFSLIINIYEYRTYTKNTNIKIATIISNLEEKYPNLSENEIMNIFENKDTNADILKKYSIDFNKNSIILENENSHIKFFVFNCFYFVITIIILIIIFLKYNQSKDRKINEITKCIEEINKKNYQLNLDDMSEDELSILKNEIYKTTIMLKEEAENSKKEKLELKDSLSDISHQLKTPLTSILIILDNLIDDPDMEKDTREDFMKDIKREITNINFLVQSLLKLSKLDTNTVSFIEEEVSIKKIMKEVEQNLSMLCDLKNIKLLINVKDDSIIKCDMKWQVEAITNIVKNAIEHSNENSRVEINAEDNKVYSKIEIKDYGKGIDKKNLPHIFERFYKGKNASQDSMGIGLALSKTIIEKNNGTISVESDNNGTKFIIKYFNL